MKSFAKMLRFVVVVGLLVFGLESMAQKTPNQLLKGVYQKLMKVKDYSVEASIRADIPLIKILPVKAVVYFKQPDKFKVNSKGIAIMPRQGFSDLAKMIKDSTAFTAVLTGTEKVGIVQAKIISIIPAMDTGNLVLAKFWIDPLQNIVMKSQLTTRSNGTMLIEYFYGSQLTNALPDKMIFTVDVKKFKIPKTIATDIRNPESKPKPTDKEAKKGTIEITFKDYKINQGLKDSIFK